MARTLWRGLLAALTLPALAAGSVATGAESPGARPSWQADPDDQFMLDVTIRQIRLGDGVRAYGTPEGTCVVFGDFIATLDVPVKIDLAAKRAAGWAFTEANKIIIDRTTGRVTYGAGKQEMLSGGTVRETPEGWCVDSNALSRWFGIGVRASTAGSALMLQSDTKLPVEMAKERHDRAVRLRPASFSLGALPQVRVPYRLWRAPALDFVVSGGMTFDARSGVRVDRRASLIAAGELATLSYQAQASTDNRGKPNSFRFRAYKSDPDGGLLGPLNATHFGFGDVSGFDSKLIGQGGVGRGAMVTNRPLSASGGFDRTHFEGDLPAGWEAELYRNGELLGFAPATADQRYHFDDVQLFYGENRIEILLYGPQGQVRSRVETVDVADAAAPPGKTWYWIGANQPGRDLIALHRPDNAPNLPKAQASVALEHGIATRTSIGLSATMQQLDDERLTFVEGTVRQSIGRSLIEVGGARDSKGGMAARVALLGRLGALNISGEALVASNFRLNGIREPSVRRAQLALDAPLHVGRTIVPAHLAVRLLERADRTREIDAAARLSTNFSRFNLATEVRYQRIITPFGPAPPTTVDASLIGAGHIGRVRLRGSTNFDLAPTAKLKAVDFSAYWAASEKADWEAGLGYDRIIGRARARLSHIRRFSTMAVALTGEAATDGSVALGFNLLFSLDPTRGFRPSREPMATAGLVRAHVYRDLNDNGHQDRGEPDEPKAIITTGVHASSDQTDKHGRALIAGLPLYQPVAVGVDETSLSDPMLAPRKLLQVVTPRAGVAADVDIGLVGAGAVEGVLVKAGGGGFEGVELELFDAKGKAVATAQSDYDGYFLFDRVAYGRYGLRIAASSAAAIHAPTGLDVTVEVSNDKTMVRLGAIRPKTEAQVIASSH